MQAYLQPRERTQPWPEYGPSGKPNRELRIQPPRAPIQWLEYDLVLRMFPTNGDQLSRVPPMNQISFLSPSPYLSIGCEMRSGRKTALAPAHFRGEPRPQLAGHWNWRKK